MNIKLICVCFALCLATSGFVHAAENIGEKQADFKGELASLDTRYAANWVTSNEDNQKQPFVIVDKKNARLFLFGVNGHLLGSTAILLGVGLGDHSVSGIATRELKSLRAEERTTPAGRFASEPGHNLGGEDIVWVDYDAKIAIHRLRPDTANEHRAKRLASVTSDDNRISMGCIVVPVSFYENMIKPVLGKHYGVVYVLPETGSAQRMFGAFDVSLNRS